MTLTQRDWENIAATRCGEHAFAVKVTMHTSRVHIDVTPETGKLALYVCAHSH